VPCECCEIKTGLESRKHAPKSDKWSTILKDLESQARGAYLALQAIRDCQRLRRETMREE
jgi:hypothetical protein